jgi:hypothetical protein
VVKWLVLIALGVAGFLIVKKFLGEDDGLLEGDDSFFAGDSLDGVS